MTTRRHQAVRNPLKTLFLGEPLGHVASRLNTLAAIISGIVSSKSTSLPSVADKVPGGSRNQGAKPESRVKRFEGWHRNKAVDRETFFLPFAEALLMSLCHVQLRLVIVGSIVGRGCMALMISVVCKQRALPIVWTVAKRRKGHFPEKIRIEPMSKAQQLVPPGTRVVVLGDGEFVGGGLQAWWNSASGSMFCIPARPQSRTGWTSSCFEDVVDQTPAISSMSPTFCSLSTSKGRFQPSPGRVMTARSRSTLLRPCARRKKHAAVTAAGSK